MNEKKFSIILPVIALALLIFAAGCVQQDTEIKEIAIPGHNNIYTFNNDIRQSILVKAENPEAIRDLFLHQNRLNVVFNGTDEFDNGMFRLALIDISAKIPFYLAYEGKSMAIDMYYFTDFDGTQWFNANNEEIDKPSLEGFTLWLKGPATGATETSVTLQDKIVLLQGTSQKNMSLAADKLTLIVFGVNNLGNLTGSK
jgi:hypothetical protein